MPNEARPATERNENGNKSILWTILKNVLIFASIQFLITQFMGNKNDTKNINEVDNLNNLDTPIKEETLTESNSNGKSKSNINSNDNVNVSPFLVSPLWKKDQLLDYSFYISDSYYFNNNVNTINVLSLKNFSIKSDFQKLVYLNLPVSDKLKKNGTVFGHLFVNIPGAITDQNSPKYDDKKAIHYVIPLSKYLPKKKEIKQKHLLHSSEDENQDEDESENNTNQISEQQIVPYWHPNISIAIVESSDSLKYKDLSPIVSQHIFLEKTLHTDANNQLVKHYYPIVFNNKFWHLRSQMQEINSTTDTLPLYFTLYSTSFFRFQLLSSFDFGMEQQENAGAASPADFEELKRVLLETNPYLLLITVVVSLLHTLFEFLAFKNDISHFKNKSNNVGISLRSIIANVFMQTIIFLYLLENTENTSLMVSLTQGISILVEAWKITKVVDVKIIPNQNNSFFILPYKIQFKDKHVLSDTEKKTKEYDQIAFKYLYIVAVPLIGAYSIYSLIYDTHKSWYSFIITTLVGSVYAYGFLMLVPSIYINYRLKSVAHMPRRAMVYKFLNTFIDDLFAFVIKMPLLHRIATLRDDIIFFIYLYQTWIYRVDYARINEFGQAGEDDQETEDIQKNESKPKKITSSNTSKTSNKDSKLNSSAKAEAKKDK